MAAPTISRPRDAVPTLPPRRLQISLSALVGAIFGLWGLAIGLRPLVDNSFLTHLATGHLILAHGIPRGDPYSFTAHGRPWTVESWLADAAMALLSNLLGPHGIQLFHALLTGSLALLMWRLTRPAGSLIPRVLAVVASLVVGTTFWSERPLLVGLVLLAVVVLLVEVDRFSWWVVMPLMWLWVNVHGSFVLAGLYVGLRLIGRRIDHRPLGRLGSLLGAVVAGTAAGALGPLGPRLLLFPLDLLREHHNFAYIVEWQHPSPWALVTIVLLAQAAVALFGAIRDHRLEDGLVVAVFTAMACVSQRNIPAATLVMVPVTARALRGIGHIRGDSRPRIGSALLAVLGAAGLVMVVQAVTTPAYNLHGYPVAELAWAQDHGLLNARLATPDFVGNLLEAELGAGHRVFIDDRVDMYPLSLVRAYATLQTGRVGAEAVLDRYGIGAVLWQADRPLARRLSRDPRWRVVLTDPRWQLAVRNSPAPARSAAGPEGA